MRLGCLSRFDHAGQHAARFAPRESRRKIYFACKDEGLHEVSLALAQRLPVGNSQSDACPSLRWWLGLLLCVHGPNL